SGRGRATHASHAPESYLSRTFTVSSWLSNGLCRAIFGGWPPLGASHCADDCSHVATLPVTLLALMGVRYFDAPLFVIGAALVVAAAATLLVAAFSRSRGKNNTTGPDAT